MSVPPQKSDTGPQAEAREAEDAADLRRQLHALLSRTPYDAEQIDVELRELLSGRDASLYGELIHQLAGIELDIEEGASCWRAAVERQRDTAERLGRPVDVRAALLDSLLAARALRSPRFVEIETFEQMERSVHRDGLTGLYNFRFFGEHLAREVERCSRRVVPLSLVMIDVDRFKKYNDRHGHEAGNRALIAVSRAITYGTRQNDVCARYGGEEFAVVMAETPKRYAVDAVERVRELIETSAAEISGIELSAPVTISAGVATCPGDAVTADELIRLADAAMYEAKEQGRNRVRPHGHRARSFRRAPVTVSGRLRSMREWELDFRTTSLGDGGFSMILGTQLSPGSVVEVEFEVPHDDGDSGLPVTGRVAYVREVSPGRFETGVNVAEMGARGSEQLSSVLDLLQLGGDSAHGLPRGRRGEAEARA